MKATPHTARPATEGDESGSDAHRRLCSLVGASAPEVVAVT